jgi:hypothetical protein
MQRVACATSEKTASSRAAWAAMLAAAYVIAACSAVDEPVPLAGTGSAESLALESVPPGSVATGDGIEVPPPPFTPGVFPCSDCHDPSVPVNTTRREMKTAHTDIAFHHDAEHRWCLDCHSVVDRDKLHLASGELIEFTESYKLCGQCHGDKYRDWRAGVHGRRSGDWDGHKSYLLCVHCHNSHSPAFQPLKPEPPPVRPVGAASVGPAGATQVRPAGATQVGPTSTIQVGPANATQAGPAGATAVHPPERQP